MLRRGLPVSRADAALVTNVAPDHLGEYGIHDVESLADAKMVVARALRPDSRLVLNADDPVIVSRAAGAPCPVTWIAAEPGSAPAAATDVWLVEDGNFVHSERQTEALVGVDEVPITFGGAARFNVYNVLGAIALARALHLPDAAIRAGLLGFAPTSEQNVGRVNVFELGGARAIIDFAHNPHGLESVLEMVRFLAPSRWLVTVGQAGDRSDEEIRELARLAWAAGPDYVIVKELPKKLRGRELGEVPRLIEEELRRRGAPAAAIEYAESDFDAVQKALAWAQEGDLLLLLLHEDRTESLGLLRDLRERGWAPGAPL
jgi:UDP-N-acetylmuramyl tripeptide synthase